MVVSLRMVLDQLTQQVDPDVAEAEAEIARALATTAPSGCEVTAIVPAGDEGAATAAVADLAGVTRAPLARAKLTASWQLGIAPGVGGGLIHAGSLVAPLVRHDRVNENDQTVVTLWDLCAWEAAGSLPRTVVAAQRALLKRAEKHADAVVVPTHAMAERLGGLSRLGGRVRVIPGAAPAGFAVPSDAVGRRRHLGVPDRVVVIAGGGCDDDALAAGLSAVGSLPLDDVEVVVSDVTGQNASRVRGVADAAGLPETSVHVLPPLEPADRAAVLDAALALLAPSTLSGFPWRVVDALALGVPIVAVASDVHREVLVDAGLFVPAAGLAEALHLVVDSEESRRRFAVRAADRGRAFSWRDHAERVWALHAEL
ncbi:MAG: glycosyltransferase [Microbacterium sp.]|uniref:glycosyltransferase n=1 Tax=Microbacterium sp. TaxID=51671 RepID=UPI0039E3E397